MDLCNIILLGTVQYIYYYYNLPALLYDEG